MKKKKILEKENKIEAIKAVDLLNKDSEILKTRKTEARLMINIKILAVTVKKIGEILQIKPNKTGRRTGLIGSQKPDCAAENKNLPMAE